MLIVATSPWGTFPSTSLVAWLFKEGYTNTRERDLKDLGINILVLIDKLRVKIVTLVNSNNMNYKMSGIGGTETSERLTQDVRRVDAQSFKAIMHFCFEPTRKKLFFDAIALLIRVKNFEVEVCKRFSTTDVDELNEFWIRFIEFEKEFYSLYGSDVYIQSVSKPFVEPSPRSVVKLYNKLRGPAMMYESSVPLPE